MRWVNPISATSARTEHDRTTAWKTDSSSSRPTGSAAWPAAPTAPTPRAASTATAAAHWYRGLIGSLQETEHRVRVGQSGFHPELVFLVLCFVIGQNDNGPPGFRARFSLHVVRRIQ